MIHAPLTAQKTWLGTILCASGCGGKADDETLGSANGSATSDDPGTAGETSSAGTGGEAWPGVCATFTTQSECESAFPTGGQRCGWVAQSILIASNDGCTVSSSSTSCVALEIQGNGCGYTPGEYASCDADDIPAWYRELDGETVFMDDLCESIPVGWQRCFANPGQEPPECECVCLAVD